jgi:CxxC motif-containing protein (DUF1111 family)
MPRQWNVTITVCLLPLICGSVISAADLAAQGHEVVPDSPTQAAQAPAGFDTPTLAQKPGSKSSSNGIEEPAGDSFELDQQIYETVHDVSTGLGPVYNARSCAECHQNPVSGGASQFTELRIGHRDISGNFVNPTIPINDGADSIAGRSIMNDRAVVPGAQEHIPASEDVRALRAALSTLGDGFVEAIDDNTLRAIAARQPELSGGLIQGEAIEVPVLEAPGQTRIGRFGWKDQHSSLLSFVGDAYLNEMGVTNRLRPKDVTNVGKSSPDPEDTADTLGLADIDHFTQFIRGTKVPPRDETLANTPAAKAGERLFANIGCAACHVSAITTARPGTIINGGMFTVPAALGNKVIHPYSDFLLHDVETGDGIVQAGPQDTADKLRTAALWGLRMRPRYMHDLKSLTLQNAIERHGGEAERVKRRFRELTREQKQQLFSFLESL